MSLSTEKKHRTGDKPAPATPPAEPLISKTPARLIKMLLIKMQLYMYMHILTRQAPSVGKLPSLRKARNIQIKAIRGGRKGRQLRKRRLRERKRRMRLRKRLPKSGCVM